MDQPARGSPFVTGMVLLGRYRLVERIGEGLGGESWHAEPIEGGPPVAIKAIRGGRAQQAHADLVREASFLRDLRHPHVVGYGGLIDLPESDITFLVTVLADGGTLENFIFQHGPQPPEVAAALLLQIAEALDAVHQVGVLHRDLKPQNIFVRQVPRGLPHLLLADFGIARRTVHNEAAFTRPMGTLGYGAPEMWAGNTVTHAADVFALGGIGWFLLTGAHPVPRTGLVVPDIAQLEATVGVAIAAGPLVGLLRETLRVEASERPRLSNVAGRLAQIADGVAVPASAATFAMAAPPSRPTLVGGPTARPVSLRTASLGSGSLRTAPRRAPLRRLWPYAVAAGLVLLIGAVGLVAVALGLARLGGPAPTAPVPEVVAAPPGPAPGAPAPGTPDPVMPAPVTPARVTPAPVAADAAPVAPRLPAGDPHPAAAVATPAPAAPVAPPAAPVGETQPPARVADAAPLDTGPIASLRVGLDSPDGLPSDATLHVIAPGGEIRDVRNTQALVTDTRGGLLAVEVRTPTKTLGRDTLAIPSGDAVRVRCAVPGGDYGAMTCTLR